MPVVQEIKFDQVDSHKLLVTLNKENIKTNDVKNFEHDISVKAKEIIEVKYNKLPTEQIIKD